MKYFPNSISWAACNVLKRLGERGSVLFICKWNYNYKVDVCEYLPFIMCRQAGRPLLSWAKVIKWLLYDCSITKTACQVFIQFFRTANNRHNTQKSMFYVLKLVCFITRRDHWFPNLIEDKVTVFWSLRTNYTHNYVRNFYLTSNDWQEIDCYFSKNCSQQSQDCQF